MKVFGILFLAFAAYLAFFRFADASTLPTNKYAFCSGYAGKMHEVYRLKHYQKMQEFFDARIGNNKDEFTSEYYQSGSEIVKNGVAIKLNVNDKCEVLFQKG